MNTTAEKIEVMQASDDGALIQFRILDPLYRPRGAMSRWGDCGPLGPQWNWMVSEYRVKPAEPRTFTLYAYDNNLVVSALDTRIYVLGKGATRPGHTTVIKVVEVLDN